MDAALREIAELDVVVPVYARGQLVLSPSVLAQAVARWIASKANGGIIPFVKQLLERVVKMTPSPHTQSIRGSLAQCSPELSADSIRELEGVISLAQKRMREQNEECSIALPVGAILELPAGLDSMQEHILTAVAKAAGAVAALRIVLDDNWRVGSNGANKTCSNLRSDEESGVCVWGGGILFISNLGYFSGGERTSSVVLHLRDDFHGEFVRCLCSALSLWPPSEPSVFQILLQSRFN